MNARIAARRGRRGRAARRGWAARTSGRAARERSPSAGGRSPRGRSGGRGTDGRCSPSRAAGPPAAAPPAASDGRRRRAPLADAQQPAPLVGVGVALQAGEASPADLARRRSHPAELARPARFARSDATSNTPWPTSPSARPMPNSSSSAADVPGTGSPSIARCTIVREVEKPSAPASSASRTIAPSPRSSSGVAGSFLRAALAHHVGAHRAVRHLRADVDRARGRSSASRYSGKVSHPQRMPSASAVPGMSSTPSISPIRKSCCRRAHRREADAAVAHHDRGDAVPARRRQSSGSQVTWPS